MTDDEDEVDAGESPMKETLTAASASPAAAAAMRLPKPSDIAQQADDDDGGYSDAKCNRSPKKQLQGSPIRRVVEVTDSEAYRKDKARVADRGEDLMKAFDDE